MPSQHPPARPSTHSNKLGVHYRYYVSHAAVQRRKQEAGTIARTAETALRGWCGRTRTRESVRNKIYLNWRHNFRGLGRNGAPETFRVRAAALGICSSRKDFGRWADGILGSTSALNR